MKSKLTVDKFIADHPQWLNELNLLRNILLDAGLNETIKWNFPVYMYDNKNTVGLMAFKSYFGLWFFEDASLSDEENLLMAAQAKTKNLRQWRMTKTTDIKKNIVKKYIKEALQIAKKPK